MIRKQKEIWGAVQDTSINWRKYEKIWNVVQNTYKKVDWLTYLPGVTPRIEKAKAAEEEYIHQELEGIKILDVGTGSGRSIDVILGKIPNAIITSIDINEQNIKNAKAKFPRNIEFLLCDVFDYKSENTFDDILLPFNFLGNIYPEWRMQVLINHLSISLKEGGKFIGSVYSESALDMQLEFYQKKLKCKTKRLGSYTYGYREDGFSLVSRRFTETELFDFFHVCGLNFFQYCEYKIDIQKKENWYLYSARKL